MPGFLPDTSVLVAAFCAWHEHHEAALAALERQTRQRKRLLLAAPVMLETYAVLTRLPAPHRLAPRSALDLVRANLRGARLVALDGAGYWKLIDEAAAAGVAGGRTYDALIVACAVRARAGALLTLNRRDFDGIVPEWLVVESPVDKSVSP